jgi:alkyl sulfatase BDS1-like metallo-beta-lactamase superfamily hydrolase
MSTDELSHGASAPRRRRLLVPTFAGRWAAELLRHVVFTDQNNTEAKTLQADMLEQMGYQAENATWRNFFLMGAQELRNGVLPSSPDTGNSPTMIAAMTLDMIFDALGARLMGPRADGIRIVMNWIFPDPDPKVASSYVIRIENGALSYVSGKQDDQADVTLTLSRDTLNKLMAKQISLKDVIEQKLVNVTGEPTALLRFFCLLDDNDPSFPIVTPRTDARAAWSGHDKLVALTASAKELMNHDKVAKARLFFGELPRGC